jgi:ABC-type transporter Mla maintaining outer membrane lipid asymmetry permease subunit MlaE
MLRRLREQLLEGVPLACGLGAGLGFSLAQVLTGPLRQDSHLTVDLLTLLTLRVFAPVGVVLVWICRSAPLRLHEAARIARARRSGAPGRREPGPPRAWLALELSHTAASCVLLLPYFAGSLLAAAMIVTPQEGLLSELRNLFRGLPALELLSGILATMLFAVTAQLICLLAGWRSRRGPAGVAAMIGRTIPTCLLTVIGLELIWIALLAPLPSIT